MPAWQRSFNIAELPLRDWPHRYSGLLLKLMILTAFYAQASVSQPISLAQAITFIWLGQALLALLPWNIDKELEAQVKNGNVSYELVRPINLYCLWYARAFAIRTVPTIMRCVPVFMIGITVFSDFQHPFPGLLLWLSESHSFWGLSCPQPSRH